jgi:hypothetical protein
MGSQPAGRFPSELRTTGAAISFAPEKGVQWDLSELGQQGLGGSPRGTSAYQAPALLDVSDCVLARGSAWEGVGKVRPKKTRRAVNPRWWGWEPRTTPNRAGTPADTGRTRYTVVNYLRRGRGWGFSPGAIRTLAPLKRGPPVLNHRVKRPVAFIPSGASFPPGSSYPV